MKWLKIIPVGMYVVNAFFDATQEDGKISIKSIINIGVEAAQKVGFDVSEIKLDVFREETLDEIKDALPFIGDDSADD